jgi:hypothetical protein
MLRASIRWTSASGRGEDGDMARYAILLLSAWAAACACNAKTIGAYPNVPYCADGNRARGCIGDKICSVTAESCQVCRCEGL